MKNLILSYWQKSTFGCVVFIVAFLTLFIMIAWHIVSSIIEQRNYDCEQGRHKWRRRGNLGCYCQYCHITLKEFIEKGGKV